MAHVCWLEPRVGQARHSRENTEVLDDRGGQTFPKSTDFRNSIAFHAVFSGFFCPFQSVVADSVSE